MALLALVENEVITRRRWLTSEEFTEGVALAQSLPGPIAVDVIAYVGYKKRGILGAATSVIAILLPSFLMMLALTWIYLRYGHIPRLQGAFRGIGPAVVAVIIAASWRMGKSILKDARQIVLFFACLAALAFHVDMILVMFATGAIGILIYQYPQEEKS